MKYIDSFLNSITMYRLVLYLLGILIALAACFGFMGWVSYSPFLIVLSVLYITAVCYITNEIFSRVFAMPSNVESLYITAFILSLILTPMAAYNDGSFYVLAGWAAVWAIASKFIFSIKRKHIFNPAAGAVVLTGFAIAYAASWWVGTAALAPFVFVCGILIVRKLHRADVVISFFVASVIAILIPALMRGSDIVRVLEQVFLNSPIFFFAFIMLTEPLTMPSTKRWRVVYGVLIGILFAPATHIGSLYFTPELALVLGNVLAYFVSPKYKQLLGLKEKIEVATGVFDFVFATDERIRFRPGQYMEWTLAHAKSDSRGNRRYFTIASSPTESTVRIGVKCVEQGSSYKDALLELPVGGVVAAGGLAGDFTLPENLKEKLVFVAGGIGVTPFRSMVTYLLDNNEERSITIFYSNRTVSDIAYSDVFEAARKRLGLKTVYVLTEKEKIPAQWLGRVGRVDAKMITEEVPDFLERTFYLSGPNSMVEGFEKTLRGMGVHQKRIKKDYFPGF